jgi:hypothetical protein
VSTKKTTQPLTLNDIPLIDEHTRQRLAASDASGGVRPIHTRLAFLSSLSQDANYVYFRGHVLQSALCNGIYDDYAIPRLDFIRALLDGRSSDRRGTGSC